LHIAIVFSYTGIRPVRFIVLEKRGELPRYQDTLRFFFQFRLTAGTLSPRRGRRAKLSNVDPFGLLSYFLLPHGEERLPL